MAGLYIHIPFCKSRCIYCGFYSTVDLNLRQQYVDALCKEMTLRPSSEPIKTIYLGGGTPSQLSIPQLRQLFLYINKVYGNDAEEITIGAVWGLPVCPKQETCRANGEPRQDLA